MVHFKHLLILGLAAITAAQNYDYDQESRPAPQRLQSGYGGSAQPKPAPIAILKQINRHNEDGSYTYGYEGADGSFKIETKLATGEVKGKYGYTDDQGKVRVVEYGATKYGFEPSGEGITVPPPTLVDETTDKNGRRVEFADDYYEPQQQQQQVEERPRPVQYSAPQQFGGIGAGPVPQRAQVTGAQQLSTTFEYVPQTRPSAVRSYQPPAQPSFRPQTSYSYQPTNAQPAPIQEDSYDEPAPARQQQQQARVTYAQPAPVSRPQAAPVQYAPRPQQQTVRAGGGGVLDQLAKDYALPQGGAAPLHDISFGYY